MSARRPSATRARKRGALRAPTFEHCEPRLALSGTTLATLDFSTMMPSVSDGNEGGFISAPATIELSQVSLDSTPYLFVGGTDAHELYTSVINSLDSKSSTFRPATTGNTELADKGTWIVFRDNENVAVTAGEASFEPIPIDPLPVTPMTGEGGSVPIAEWPSRDVGPERPDVEPTPAPQMVDAPTTPQLPNVSPQNAAQSEVSHVEALRGRAILFDVAAQSTPLLPRHEQQPRQHESPAVEPTQEAIAPTATSPSAQSASSHVAAVDAAHESLPPVAYLRHAASTPADEPVVRAVAVRRDESTAETVASTTASQPSTEARDEALVDDSPQLSERDAAALFDPTRNRPILGVAAVSLLMAAHSLYGSLPSADRAPTEPHLPRHVSPNGQSVD